MWKYNLIKYFVFYSWMGFLIINVQEPNYNQPNYDRHICEIYTYNAYKNINIKQRREQKDKNTPLHKNTFVHDNKNELKLYLIQNKQ